MKQICGVCTHQLAWTPPQTAGGRSSFDFFHARMSQRTPWDPRCQTEQSKPRADGVEPTFRKSGDCKCTVLVHHCAFVARQPWLQGRPLPAAPPLLSHHQGELMSRNDLTWRHAQACMHRRFCPQVQPSDFEYFSNRSLKTKTKKQLRVSI